MRDLVSGAAIVLVLMGASWAAATAAAPVLATPDQVEAERALLKLEADPQILAVKTRLKAELAATPTGQTKAGVARIDEAIDQWTRSVIFKDLAHYRSSSAILWATDDTPRSWLGHTLGGVGTAGDNPDNIYRVAYIDGASRYEIVGHVDPAHRPAQFSFEIDRGDGAQPAKLKDQTAKHADMGNQLAMLTDRDLKVSAGGEFRITLGGPPGGPNHVALQPGLFTVGVRDSLSDWGQRPMKLAIRRLDGGPAKPLDLAEVRSHVVEDLEDYVQFWSAFGGKWFGGLAPNAYAGPIARDGGWGFVAGVRFKLAPDEAILVTTTTGGAKYTGFQVTDPWMIAPDAKRYQTSLNLSQSVANPDGSYSYVIAATDPGVANWIDTAGLDEGFAVLRWQGLPPGATKDGLLREFKVVKLSELSSLPKVSPAERRQQLAERADGYANRVR